MRQLSYFLMVGLAFTVLQISTVSAEDPPPMGDPGMPHDGPPPGEHHDGPPPGMPHDGPPPGGHHPPGEHHDGPPPGMPHDGPPPGGHHPPGEHHDGPPIDPRSGQPFTKADEDKYEVYANECEQSGGVISEASAQALITDGFTRLQVDELCKEGAHHDGPHEGPPGGPGMAPPAP